MGSDDVTADPCDSFRAPALVNGYLLRTSVKGPAELECLLIHWYARSDRPTIGDVGDFGGAPHITIEMRDRFVLNRDTTRSAVAEFLSAARSIGGAEKLRWHVIRNARGRVNKVSYRQDGASPTGWFAYLRTPAHEPRDLR